MARKKRQRNGDEAKGEAWRREMTDGQESLPSLVWKRVFRLFQIDLSDPKQASGEQIYRLLRDLMDTRPDLDAVEVATVELESLVDAAVPGLFDLR